MKRVYLLMALTLLSACSQRPHKQQSSIAWDFDHQVQFKQTQLAPGRYHLKIINQSDTEFSTLATFLLRKSLVLCQSYGFKIEVLDGVEQFNDKLAMPNRIMPSLSANVTCPKSYFSRETR